MGKSSVWIATVTGTRQLLIFLVAMVGTPAAVSAQSGHCSPAPTPPAPPWQYRNNPPPTPVLLTPAHSTTLSTNRPVFSWTPVVDLEGDTVIFEIQIDDNADFSSPEVQTRGQRHATLTPERPLPDGTYCWRVRTIDDIEATSPYSGAFAVTIRSGGGTAAGAAR